MKKRVLSLFMSFILVFSLIMNNSAVLASSKTSGIPKLKMINQPSVEYHFGERISFTVSSPNYGGAVQYRVILYNGTTKKTSELWPGFPGYFYTKWQPSGNYNFKINWPVQGMEPGAYSLTVLVRRVGAKVPYDSFVNTNTFWVKDASSTNSSSSTNTTTQPSDKALDVKEIAKNNTSVLLLKCFDKDNTLIGTGSGFLVSQDGKVLTNFHVIEGASKIKAISHDEKEYDVEGVLNYSTERDIAILSVKGLSNLPCLAMGDSDKLDLGESIVAIGSPLGLQNTVSTGIVSSIRKSLIRDVAGAKDIQISAPISSGSSGGALFNAKGEVVGITYAGFTEIGQNLNFAIPINEAKALLQTTKLKTLSELLLIIPNPVEGIKTIKYYSYLSNYYNNLSTLGYNISRLHTNLSLLVEDIINSDNTNYTDDYDNAYEQLKYIIDEYNKFIEESPDVISEAKEFNIDMSNINSILKNYYNSIEYFKAALDDLESYSDSHLDSDIKSFINNMKDGIDISIDAVQSCENSYSKLYNKIISFSSTNKDVNIVRIYSILSSCYKYLRSFGYSINLIDNEIYFSHIFIKDNSSSEYINALKESLSTITNAYNDMPESIKEIVSKTKEIGIDVGDITTILSGYSKSLEYYKAALNELINYKNSKSDECIKKIADNTDKGYPLLTDANKLAMQGYNKFYTLVQEY